MNALRHPALHWLVSFVLGGVFLYASVDKIVHPGDFARIVYRYQVVGPSRALGYVPANLVAVVLPWLEALLGVLLVLGLWRREAAALAALLLAAFVAGVSSALLRGIDLENCGCFSVSGAGRSAGLWLIAGDLLLLAGALLLVLVTPRAPEPRGTAEPAVAP